MRWAWWAAAVAVAVAAAAAPVATSASDPVSAQTAQTECADLAPVTDFNTFVLGDHRITNNDVYGRVAIGGDALFNTLAPQGSISLGNGLSPKNVNRNDLIVRGDIVSPGNVTVNSGSAIYAGALVGSINAYGSVTRVDAADLPFDFDDVFTRLNALEQSWADVPDQKAPELIGAGGANPRLRFVGTSRTLNVFSVSAAELQRAETIQIGVPGGTATTLINVSGSSYTSADRPTTATEFNVADPVGNSFEKVGVGDTTSDKAKARAKLVWSFHDADTVQLGSDNAQGPTVRWEGTVIAPKATVILGRSTDLIGTLVAARVEQTGTARLPGLGDGACLPPPCEPPTEPPTEPEPEPTPPPLPPQPIQPSPPGTARPPDTGAVAGQQAGSTRIFLCKRRNRARVRAGGTVTFRLEVRNLGLATAERVVVCDRLPAGLRIVRARGAQVRNGRACWRFASLRSERTMHIKARVSRSARGVIRNTAHARAANAQTVRGRARIRVLAAPVQLCSAFCG